MLGLSNGVKKYCTDRGDGLGNVFLKLLIDNKTQVLI
jgi:hypothetical protein